MKLKVFKASWCGPCKQLAPILEKIKPDFALIDFEELSLDDTSSIEEAKKYNVRGIPHLVLLDSNENEMSYKVGALTEQKLRLWLGGFIN